MSRPYGELANTITHEASEDWPNTIEIVAYFGPPDRPKARRKSIEIDADQFFGRKGWGAPLSGEVLIGMVERLRRTKPKV